MRDKIFDKALSVLLILLSCTAIAMLFNLWYAPTSAKNAYFGVDSTELPNSIAHLIDVSRLQIKQGDGYASYTYDKGDSFKLNQNFFSTALSRYDDAEAISKNDYTLVKASDHITYELGFTGSVAHTVSILTNEFYKSTLGDDKLHTILLSSQFNDRIFIHTSRGYYMLLLGEGRTFDYTLYIKQIDPTISEHIALNDKVMFRDNRDKSFNAIEVANELNIDQIDVKSELSRILFGDRQDFIQELIDVNGATLMLYGYGEKSLKISRDGLIDYTQNVDKRSLSSNSNFYKDLSYAYAVINKLSHSDIIIYLSSATPITHHDTAGYEFKFHYRINDYVVDNIQHSAGIKVKIAGGELISYTRDIKLPKSMGLFRSGKSLTDILNSFTSKNIISSPASIKKIRALYAQDILTLIPAYQIQTESESYYVNAVTGKLLYLGDAR